MGLPGKTLSQNIPQPPPAVKAEFGKMQRKNRKRTGRDITKTFHKLREIFLFSDTRNARRLWKNGRFWKAFNCGKVRVREKLSTRRNPKARNFGVFGRIFVDKSVDNVEKQESRRIARAGWRTGRDGQNRAPILRGLGWIQSEPDEKGFQNEKKGCG